MKTGFLGCLTVWLAATGLVSAQTSDPLPAPTPLASPGDKPAAPDQKGDTVTLPPAKPLDSPLVLSSEPVPDGGPGAGHGRSSVALEYLLWRPKPLRPPPPVNPPPPPGP